MPKAFDILQAAVLERISRYYRRDVKPETESWVLDMSHEMYRCLKTDPRAARAAHQLLGRAEHFMGARILVSDELEGMTWEWF